MIPILLFALLLGISTPAYATDQLDLQIQQLLNLVSASNCSFVRNGKTHNARESVKHISRKYAHYEHDIDSIDSFIELTATKSLFTGKQYLVNCDGQIMPSAKWMHGKVIELGQQS
ncbi:MAG: DUF5329 family protein [Gammaproteobacteria bacterium]|jgi:hypothetical protein|nr:DUF5329 family protein [Gammaproteobacteria bacterium]